MADYSALVDALQCRCDCTAQHSIVSSNSRTRPALRSTWCALMAFRQVARCLVFIVLSQRTAASQSCTRNGPETDCGERCLLSRSDTLGDIHTALRLTPSDATGFIGVTQEDCESRNCCWQPVEGGSAASLPGVPSCYHAHATPSEYELVSTTLTGMYALKGLGYLITLLGCCC